MYTRRMRLLLVIGFLFLTIGSVTLDTSSASGSTIPFQEGFPPLLSQMIPAELISPFINAPTAVSGCPENITIDCNGPKVLRYIPQQGFTDYRHCYWNLTAGGPPWDMYTLYYCSDFEHCYDGYDGYALHIRLHFGSAQREEAAFYKGPRQHPYGSYRYDPDCSGDPLCDYFDYKPLCGPGFSLSTPVNGGLQFDADSYSIDEAKSSVTIPVERVFGTVGAVTVDYATSNGTAYADQDYTHTEGTLNFGDGETKKSFNIPILQDEWQEGGETVNIELSNATGGAFVGFPETVLLTIADIPDLKVNAFNLNPLSVFYSSGRYLLPVNVIVENIGGGDPVTMVEVNFEGSDGYKTTKTIAKLDPGESKKLRVDWDITAALKAGKGLAKINMTVTVDPNDNVQDEVTEDNNAHKAEVSVDLRPTLTKIEPDYFIGWFMKDVKVQNGIHVTIDWNGSMPGNGGALAGSAIYELNGKATSVDVPEGGIQATHTYNMGADLKVGENELLITASTKDGFVSEPTLVQPKQTSVPNWLYYIPGIPVAFDVERIIKTGPDLVIYRTALKFPPSILLGAVEAPKDKAGPLGGKMGPTIPTWELSVETRNDGAGIVLGIAGLNTEVKDIPFKGEATGSGSYTFGGKLLGAIQVDKEEKVRLTDAYAAIKGSGRLYSPVWRVPAMPVVGLQLAGGLDIEVQLKAFEKLDTEELKFRPDVVLRIEPLLEGIALAGKRGLAYIEGVIGTKPRGEFQFFSEPFLKTAMLRAYLRVSAGVLWFEKTYQWMWRCYLVGGSSQALMLSPEHLEGLAASSLGTADRDYITPTYATFVGNSREIHHGDANPIVADAYPYADPAAAYLGAGNVLALWVHDDAGKEQHQGLELKASQWNGTSWSAPVDVTSDTRMDFQPSLAADGSGALAVWTRLKHPITDTVPTAPDELYDEMEIAYATYDTSRGTWNAPQMLTDNTVLDMLPNAVGRAGKVMVMWLRDADNDFPVFPDEASALSEQVYYAIWDGASWTVAPTLALNDVATAEQPQFAYDGSKAIYVWSGDTDGDATTIADRDIYYATWSSGTGTWSTAQRLSNDSDADQSPLVVYDSTGEAHILWIKESPKGGDPGADDFTAQLYYVTLNGAGRSTPAMVLEAPGIEELTLANAWADGNDDLYAVWKGVSSHPSDLYHSVYDFEDGSWSRASQLTDNREAEWAYDAVYDDLNDELFLVLMEREVNTEVVEVDFPVETAALNSPDSVLITETIPITMPVFGSSDLAWKTHAPAPDLAITSENIRLDPTNPAPGGSAVISATVENLGDLAADPVKVSFYDGDPGAGGTQIGAIQTLGTSLAGGLTATLTVNWNLPTSPGNHDIYVEVDPLDDIDEGDEGNNQAMLSVVLPDLKVAYGYAVYDGENSFDLVARIANQGTSTASNVQVEFRQNAITGTLLGQQTLASLTADQAENVTITWDITSLGLSTNTIFVLVDPADTIQEADEDNNIGALWANILPDLTVTTLDLQGDGTVDVTVDNLGLIATENISVEVRRETSDGTLVDSVLIPSLYPGISNTLTMDLGSGDFSFYVLIDPDNLIPETDESNNAAVYKVAVSTKVYLPLIAR